MIGLLVFGSMWALALLGHAYETRRARLRRLATEARPVLG